MNVVDKFREKPGTEYILENNSTVHMIATDI
jgi:hypothetical protein